MRFELDTETNTLKVEDEAGSRTLPLYSKEAFEALSRHWVRIGWQQKYQYTFSWMGRPIIQLPEDIIRVQEAIWRIKPDVVIETGVAHGGSLIFYASLCKALDKGRVIGIDIEIRPHNRTSIEAHSLARYITLVEGSSVAPDVTRRVKELIKAEETTLVVLDSNHSYAHVLAELDAYGPLVSIGSYIVATDGIMFDLADVPRGNPSWAHDNPMRAASNFVRHHPNFIIEQPAWPFNESALDRNITHWPGAWLKRIS
jgi:cephalosporin hydroxylase